MNELVALAEGIAWTNGGSVTVTDEDGIAAVELEADSLILQGEENLRRIVEIYRRSRSVCVYPAENRAIVFAAVL